MTYTESMITIAETDKFSELAEDIWTEEEFSEFRFWLAQNPEEGKLVKGTGGLRKIRWSRAGMGKSGGARIIYYYIPDDGLIWLLMIYTKAKFDNLPTAFLNQLKAAITDD